MPKIQAHRCPNCKTKKGKNLAMHRLYVRINGKWKTVGWVCLKCDHAEIATSE